MTAATRVPATIEPYLLDATLAPATVASLADTATLHTEGKLRGFAEAALYTI